MFDFPNSPTLNQVAIGATGAVYSWDGVKWVAGGGIPVAPTPPYGDNSTKVATTAFVQETVAPAFNDIGRNTLHNAMFNISQRTGPWTVNGYTLDRWERFLSLDTGTISQAAFTPGTPGVDEDAAYALGNTFAGNAGATAYNCVFQPIENVRRLSNRTVIVSFYANVASGTLRLGVSLTQKFGTGGSPSVDVVLNGQSALVGGGYARYSMIFIIPSIVGKILGTNNDHSTYLYFWYSAGANINTQAGSIGVQSGTVYLWGVQCEVAQPGQTQPSPLEKLDQVLQLQQCLRFYQTYTMRVPAAANLVSILYPTPFRATPAIAGGGTGFAAVNASATGATISQTTAASGVALTFTADL